MLNRTGWWVGVLALAWLAVGALPDDVRGQGLKLVGYGDLEWSLQETGNPDDQWHNFFDNHHFNLIAVGWITDDLQAAGEVEYEHAGDEIALEYAYIAYTGFRSIRFAGGKFIIPFNRFNKDLHPSWINKVPGRPTVYGNVFPSTYSDVGVWVSGGIPAGRGVRVVYDAYVVNGLKGDAGEFNFRDLRDNDRDKPTDDNKAVGGRVGVELPSGLGIGGSVYTGGYAQDTVTADRLDVTFLGGDVDYHWRGLELRGEFVYAKQDLAAGADADRKGFYAQAAYSLSGIRGVTPLMGRFEPVVRYSWVDFDDQAYGAQEDELDSQELGLGLNFYVSASSSLRAAYFLNIEKDPFKTDNDKFVAQWNVAF